MIFNIILFRSELHDSVSTIEVRKPFFERLKALGELKIIESSNYSQPLYPDNEESITICFIGTGGTEEKFIQTAHLLPRPIILVSDGYHNSFAATFEIATWLSYRDIPHKFINVPIELDSMDFSCITDREHRIETSAHQSTQFLYDDQKILGFLYKNVIGLIGGESSWLISSGIDKSYIARCCGAKFVEIPIEELISIYHSLPKDGDYSQYGISSSNRASELSDALRLTKAFEEICTKYSLTALTVKCFDLLKPCHTTSCLALSILNDKGIVSGCEGDIPTLWTMIVSKARNGAPTFMVNPSSASPDNLTVDFAHCTVPISMTNSYSLPTHFESSIGVAIAGILPLGKYSLMKIGGEKLDKLFYCEGEIICNTSVLQRCRTQVRFKFKNMEDYDRFFSNRLGNHLILSKIN